MSFLEYLLKTKKMAKKIVRLTESDLVRLVKKVILEQEGGNPLTFSKVVEIPGQDKNSLYNSLIQALTLVFNSINDVKQMDDKEQGIIILKPKMKFEIKGLGLTGYSGYLNFTIKIQIKDNKFKIDIMDLVYTGNPSYPNTNLGLITDREEHSERGKSLMGMADQYNKVWKQLKEQIPLKMESVIKMIEEKTKTSKQDDFKP